MQWITAPLRIPEKPFLTLQEVAIAVGYSTKHVRRLMKAGKFPGPKQFPDEGPRWSAMSVGVWIAWREHGPSEPISENDPPKSAPIKPK